MRKFSFPIGVLITIVLVGAAFAVWMIKRQNHQRQDRTVLQTQDDQKVRRPTAAASWEPVYFKIINERTYEARIPDLRTVLPPDDGFEIRVWIGFGINGEDGIILRHSSNQWSAFHLHGMAERPPFNITLRTLDTPRSGWEAAWQRLTEAGILTMPDATIVNCNTYILDGTSYVVEINKNKRYRTYMYDNPNHAPCNEAKQVLRISEIIAEEFDLRTFKVWESRVSSGR